MSMTEIIRRAHRLLVVDDNVRIHEDIRKILCPATLSAELDDEEAALFGTPGTVVEQTDFELDSAYQGQEALELVNKSLLENRPYSLAFVDVRMPPGWDGIETIRNLWAVCPDLQIVICTAYSDHSWEQIVKTLGKSDNMVILKKPFDNVEVLQLAHAMTRKWVVTRQARWRVDDLEAMVERRTSELVESNSQLTTEITQRTEVERALRRSEERFHSAFDGTSVALGIMSADARKLTEVNQSFLTLTGYSLDQLLDRSPLELGLVPDTATARTVQSAFEEGRIVQNLEVSLRRANGDLRQALLSLVPLKLGEQDSLIIAVVDVTEQRRLEAQLRQSQKMEAIGQLAAGVAHDFNNLLTVIIGHASIQLKKATLDHDVNRSLEQVKLAGERASGLTRQLLAFSRRQAVHRYPVDLNHALQSMHKMLARLVGETITFQCSTAEKLPCVLADESNIEQVLLNLVVNARDAMTAGGRLEVTLERKLLLGEAARRHDNAREGCFVVLTVSDTGCGMTTETQRRLFEPFFTTKPAGSGTGLGLSTVYGIVKQHEGWIEVESEIAVGSTFRVFLPATDERARFCEVKPVSKPSSSHNQTVLVVEDEPQVRAFVSDALRQHGYKVLDADCGQKALELWERAGDREVKLLLTDLVMPNGISGHALARMLRERRKELPVVYMSGYANETDTLNDRQEDSAVFLAKPFSQGMLVDVIDRAVGALTAAAAEDGAASI